MKSLSCKFVLLIILFWGSNSFSQTNHRAQKQTLTELYSTNTNSPFTPQEMKMLEEVYGEHLQSEVLNNRQLSRDLKHLLRNRVVYFEESNPNNHKDYVLLSSIPLFNYFVKDLKRDVLFNKSAFNPLKYQMTFFGKTMVIYRIDNTNQFIMIKPQTGR